MFLTRCKSSPPIIHVCGACRASIRGVDQIRKCSRDRLAGSSGKAFFYASSSPARSSHASTRTAPFCACAAVVEIGKDMGCCREIEQHDLCTSPGNLDQSSAAKDRTACGNPRFWFAGTATSSSLGFGRFRWFISSIKACLSRPAQRLLLRFSQPIVDTDRPL